MDCSHAVYFCSHHASSEGQDKAKPMPSQGEETLRCSHDLDTCFLEAKQMRSQGQGKANTKTKPNQNQDQAKTKPMQKQRQSLCQAKADARPTTKCQDQADVKSMSRTSYWVILETHVAIVVRHCSCTHYKSWCACACHRCRHVVLYTTHTPTLQRMCVVCVC
jgi:hypothetical protein